MVRSARKLFGKLRGVKTALRNAIKGPSPTEQPKRVEARYYPPDSVPDADLTNPKKVVRVTHKPGGEDLWGGK